ncbi:MAG: hypothetical protein ABI867_18985 [Kofleriaceae bacterium]
MWASEPTLVVWAIYLLLVPFYVFKSGLPQPGDMFILVLVPIALRGWNGRMSNAARLAFRPLLVFTIWVCVVDYAWAIGLGNFDLFGRDTFILFPIYYIYNAFIFLSAILLYRRFGDAFLRLTVEVVLVTIYVQAATSLVFQSTAVRGSLFFNSPNQLGYFALLAASLIALTHRRLKMKLVSTCAALSCCAYLALISASRASVLGIAILFALIVFTNPRVIIVTSIIAVIVLMVGGPISDALESTQQRVLADNSARGGFFEERGYDRIAEHPEYLMFGAGEGGLARFDSTSRSRDRMGRPRAIEIHSSFGMIVFSYGIIGSLVFMLFMWRIIKGAPLRLSMMLLPPMLYTIAHQGLRFTMLWVLLAIFVCLKEPIRTKVVAAP